MSETPPAQPTVAAPLGTDLAERVLQAQVTALYERSANGVKVGFVLALIVFVGLRPYMPTALLWAWLGARAVTVLLRLALHRAHQRSTQGQAALWHRRFVIGLACDGLIWGGLGCWLVLHGRPEQYSLVMVALVGVASVGLFVMQSSWRASSALLVTTLVPMSIVLLVTGGKQETYAGVALLLYFGFMARESRLSERAVRELHRLRFSTDRIAEEREQALKLAQRQSSVKSQFLATMSHEMRTPLHGILGLTRQMQQREGVPPEPQLAMVEKAGEHLLRLINDALDYSKLEAGKVTLTTQVFDLAALIDEVLSLLLPSAYQSGLALNSRWHMPRPCWVVGDPARLRQVLHNLVGNAIKFTEVGGVTVVAKHNSQRGRARIAVHDTGVGMAPADLPLIFDAFQQADSSFARRFAGTGLGLTIARELARAMGGDLVCTSQLGRGSCFTVTVDLPAAPAAPTVDVVVDEGPAARALVGRVLLAEDNPVNALVAEAVLGKLGLIVEVVIDGQQALEAFVARRHDLVLLDCQMPVMDGLEAARAIRAHEQQHGWPRTPVIALTANALEGDREHSLAAGMDEHLAKPFRDEELHAVLARYLNAPSPSGRG